MNNPSILTIACKKEREEGEGSGEEERGEGEGSGERERGRVWIRGRGVPGRGGRERGRVWIRGRGVPGRGGRGRGGRGRGEEERGEGEGSGERERGRVWIRGRGMPGRGGRGRGGRGRGGRGRVISIYNNLKNAIKKHATPVSNWRAYNIAHFEDNIYRNYAIARLKSMKAEHTSDLNSDIDEKRRRIQKVFSDDRSEDENYVSKILPNPPTLKKARHIERQQLPSERLPNTHEELPSTSSTTSLSRNSTKTNSVSGWYVTNHMSTYGFNKHC
ncbi:hypothetical protein QE152_g40188 [Popillia japonica]|uniref:Uncharacterized protein n=1 Tax=Popillia japonica TaxID=7064 RepID=A0AAW1HS75_POPJA